MLYREKCDLKFEISSTVYDRLIKCVAVDDSCAEVGRFPF